MVCSRPSCYRVALLLAWALLWAWSAASRDASPHRCLHSRSPALQGRAASAARLAVEYHPTHSRGVVEPEEVASRRGNTTSGSNSALRASSYAAVVQRQRAEQPNQHRAPFTPFALTGPPLRVHFDVSHLFNGSHYCTTVLQRRFDKLGDTALCAEEDVLSRWKRRFVVHRLLPLLGNAVQQWLSLRADKSGGADLEAAAASRASARRTSRIFVPQGVCGEHVAVPPAHTRDGVRETDFVVYVMAAPLHDATTVKSKTAAASSSSRTVAWATYCAVDGRTDRPVVAIMNIVPSSLNLRDEFDVGQATQGSGHDHSAPVLRRALSKLVPHFGSETPGTRGVGVHLRDRAFAAAQAMDAYYTSWTVQHYRAVLHELLHALGFAPPQLLRHAMTVRATLSAKNGLSTFSGLREGTIVVGTPAVRSAAQRWLNCSDARVVPGAALERSGGDGTAGAHWERAQFRDDLMASVLSPAAALSEMTLAFLDSLPYYHANRDFAELPWWGHNAGCSFGAGDCRPLPRFSQFQARQARGSDADRTRARYWCEAAPPTSPRRLQCTADRRAIGFCFATREIRATTPTSQTPVIESRGLSLLMEGCPVVEAYANMVCDSSDGGSGGGGNYGLAALGDGTPTDAAYRTTVLEGGRGFYFGAFSRCFATSDLHRVAEARRAAFAVAATSASYANASGAAEAGAASTGVLSSARCLQTRCAASGRSVEVRVGDAWLACPQDGRARVMAVPATWGYTGYVGCEEASMYCAGAPELVARAPSTPPPLREVATATEADADDGELPFFRVTAAFFVAFDALRAVNPLSAVDTDSAIGGGVDPIDLGFLFRSVLIKSDTALVVALHGDLARRRAQLRLSPLGAVMGQRRVGATRLVGAAIAVLAEEPSVNTTSPSRFSQHWDALISAEMDVVAHTADEAAAATNAWLTETGDGVGAAPRYGFPAVEDWLSRLACAAAVDGAAGAAAAAAARKSGAKSRGDGPSCRAASLFSLDDHVVAFVEEDAGGTWRDSRVVPPVCAAWRTGELVEPGSSSTWRVTANGVPYLSVAGPLDGVEVPDDEVPLREAALVQVRLQHRPFSARSSAATPVRQPTRTLSAAGGTSLSAPCAMPERDFTGWVSEAGLLLSLQHDLGALLGISPKWLRLRAIREAAESESASARPETETGTVDVLVAASLPVFDESAGARLSAVTRGLDARYSPGAAAASAAVTFAQVAAHTREVWVRLLASHSRDSPHAELALPSVNSRLGELQTVLCRTPRASDAATTAQHATGFVGDAPCSSDTIVLSTVVGVHAPEPGAVPAPFTEADIALSAGWNERVPPPPWSHRRLFAVAGVPVTTGAVVMSGVAVLLLLAVFSCAPDALVRRWGAR